MNRLFQTATITMTLTILPALAAAPQVTALDGHGAGYTVLPTESSWLALVVPLTALGGTVPDDLGIRVSGLPTTITITLDDVTISGENALLHVTVSRSDMSIGVNSLAVLALLSGGEVLTKVSIPVTGLASVP
ncbi:hypothetical protein [Deinococcus yunweiensis]|uniref:hypothetical protein n=1 Tax=Deinococcus yunweiensis TaxID=367282 RepID=UPI00398E515D